MPHAATTPAPTRRRPESGSRVCFAMVPGTWAREARTLDVVLHTGAIVQRFSWSLGDYRMRLDMSDEAADLSRLNNGAPFLLQHGAAAEPLLGVFVDGSVRIEKGQLLGTVQFLPADIAEAAGVEHVIQGIVQGFRRNVSFGFDLGEMVLESHAEGETDLYRVARWAAFEGSSVLMGADDAAGYLSADTGQRTTEETEAMADPIITSTVETERAAMRAQEQQLAATRTKDILTAARKLDFAATKPEVLALLEEQVETTGGTKRYLTTDEARARLIDLRATEADAIVTSGVSRGGVVLGEEDGEKRGAGIANALLHRCQPSKHALTDAGRRYVGLRLGEIAREVVGEHYGADRARTLNPVQVATLALQMRSERMDGRGIFAGERFALSTSDFPLILADVTNKMLRTGYEIAPRTFLEWAARGTAPDYRAQNEPILDGASLIQAVTENGTYQEGTVREGSESWRVARRGILVRITPEMVTNDNLDAFTLIPMRIGDSASLVETAIVYGLLTSNAALVEDAVALFAAAHGNLITAGGGLGAPSGTTAAAMRSLARLQTNRQGQLLNIELPHLIFPSAHEGTVEQLLDIALSPTTAANATTGFLRTRRFHVEPLLDATSATQWYMAADPARVSTIKYGWLQGQEGVSIGQEIEFASSALVIKGEHVFGAGVMDHRGLYRNNGA